MPKQKKVQTKNSELKPYKKGSLYIKFEIAFPKQLTEDQKNRLEKVLSAE